MMPWYGAAVLALAGIVAYDHREDIARYLPDRPATKTAGHSTRPDSGRSAAAARTSVPAGPSANRLANGAGSPVPPLPVPSVAPQPAAKPVLASLPPAAIAAGPTAAGGEVKMVGTGFKGPFYYCGRSGLDDCVAEAGVFWHDKTAVRLADVSMPSAESAKCDAERQRGFRAKVRLRELLDAGPFDLALSQSGDRQQAGAKLRVAMRGGHSIGEQLVREGLAKPNDGTATSWCS